MPKRAVLLLNLGSPKSPSIPDVRTYLREFLGDKRVLDIPAPLRWLLLEGIILRTRPKKSAHAYATIWQPEGSPLVLTTQRAGKLLGAKLEGGPAVYVAMRYAEPSISRVVAQMVADGIEEVLLFPQYPHYAMSSWETVVEKVYAELARQAPKIHRQIVQPFYGDADYIEALAESVAPYLAQPYDHLLFSYHGIPERHLRKADSSRAHCLRFAECCSVASPAHATCYRAQIFCTTRALAARMKLDESRFSVSFQSRLAGEPWLQPFTDFELARLPKSGVKKLLVLCPAFVADCLETLEEIAMQGRETFLEAGGITYQQVPCLNDHPAYIDFLAKRVKEWQLSPII